MAIVIAVVPSSRNAGPVGYTFTVCQAWDTVQNVCTDATPSPQFEYPVNPPQGDARTAGQWQAAAESEAIAIVAASQGASSPQATLADDTLTITG